MIDRVSRRAPCLLLNMSRLSPREPRNAPFGESNDGFTGCKSAERGSSEAGGVWRGRNASLSGVSVFDRREGTLGRRSNVFVGFVCVSLCGAAHFTYRKLRGTAFLVEIREIRAKPELLRPRGIGRLPRAFWACFREERNGFFDLFARGSPALSSFRLQLTDSNKRRERFSVVWTRSRGSWWELRQEIKIDYPPAAGTIQTAGFRLEEHQFGDGLHTSAEHGPRLTNGRG